jgi:GT2 family glycosyltransferase/glycosyltransferase involved in cell wall biosynthesis
MTVKVDVIIPIYVPSRDVFCLLCNCVQSVLNRTYHPYRLILIDDASPFEEVDPYLQKVKQENAEKEIVHLRNKVNRGFVLSANRGMMYGKLNDVLVLNNDTEVTTGWLSRMVQCAYSNPKIATVSPLSNNATLCSIPKMNTDNPIPEGFTVEDVGKVVQQYSPGVYPELPSVHGFCIYIKRSVLDEIGYFDEDNFSTGYGEECDFSARCIERGYYSVLDDRTFVYHRGEASFQGKRSELAPVNYEKLLTMHPYMDELVKHFVTADPLLLHRLLFESKFSKRLIPKIRSTVDSEDAVRGQKNVLVVLFDWKEEIERSTWVGGDRYVNDLCSAMSSEYKFYLLMSNCMSLTLSEYPDGKKLLEYSLTNRLAWGNIVSNKDYAAFFECLLVLFQIDLIHINSIRNHSFDVVRLAHRHGIPCLYVLHDFELICPSIFGIDDENRFCGFCAHGDEKRGCLENNRYFRTCFPLPVSANASLLHQYRDHVKKHFLPYIDLFIAPSYSTKDHFSRFYGTDNIMVIYHGIFSEKPDPLRMEKTKKDDKIHIGLLGHLNHEQKGIGPVRSVLKNLDRNLFKVSLYGPYVEIEDVEYRGTYDYREITDKLKASDIDVILLLPIWPETFSYVLSEAMIAQIPVIVSNRGALKERVDRYDAGWVVDADRTDEVVRLLYDIHRDRSLLKRKKRGLETLRMKDIETMALEYGEVYRELTSKKRPHYQSINTSLLSVLKGQNFRIQQQPLLNESLNPETEFRSFQKALMKYPFLYRALRMIVRALIKCFRLIVR